MATWFLAASPMSLSESVKATYEGVVRLPWSLAGHEEVEGAGREGQLGILEGPPPQRPSRSLSPRSRKQKDSPMIST